MGEDALLRRVSERHGKVLSREDLLVLIAAGDGATLDVIDNAGRKLGLAVANMITLLNPELLIICGEGTDLGGAFLEPIVTAVREHTFANLGQHIDIKIQSWGDEAWAVRRGHISPAGILQPSWLGCR